MFNEEELVVLYGHLMKDLPCFLDGDHEVELTIIEKTRAMLGEHHSAVLEWDDWNK
ncbi:hypothetical protein [Dickeya phage Amaethon]|nr:hypothetical protein [Dickeya phage Amaethon]